MIKNKNLFIFPTDNILNEYNGEKNKRIKIKKRNKVTAQHSKTDRYQQKGSIWINIEWDQ